jgi:hypothetical protein
MRPRRARTASESVFGTGFALIASQLKSKALERSGKQDIMWTGLISDTETTRVTKPETRTRRNGNEQNRIRRKTRLMTGIVKHRDAGITARNGIGSKKLAMENGISRDGVGVGDSRTVTMRPVTHRKYKSWQGQGTTYGKAGMKAWRYIPIPETKQLWKKSGGW